jgi:L,D-transpeptidase ErfK/SrfK
LALLRFGYPGPANAGGYAYCLPSGGDPAKWVTVVGNEQTHTIAPKETLLDVARLYDLGFNEMQLPYPNLDPWIPAAGTELTVPTEWVLPAARAQGIVINLPEMRLYQFFPKEGMVKTYPVGIGDALTETPEGSYRVVGREVDPTWTIPESLRWKYPVASVPPGPDNPLGKYWLTLSARGYGIHGTNFPWCVGRLISNGCIRLYPEDIEQLFKEVPVNTPVEIVYEPVKVGFRDNVIYVEVHPDSYGRFQNLEPYAIERLIDAVGLEYVSLDSFREAVQACSGVPVPIGTLWGIQDQSKDSRKAPDGRAADGDRGNGVARGGKG